MNSKGRRENMLLASSKPSAEVRVIEESEDRGRFQKGGREPDHLRLWFSFQPRRL